MSVKMQTGVKERACMVVICSISVPLPCMCVWVTLRPTSTKATICLHRQGLSLILSLWLGWLAGEPLGSSCLCLPCAETKVHAPQVQLFYVGPEDQTQVLLSAVKYFTE